MKELIWHRQLLPALDRYAAKPFLTDTGTGRTSSYGEHGTRVLRLASALRSELGVQPGERVAVMALNSAAFEEVYHACLLGTAVVNPLNLRFAPPEVAHVLSDSGTKVVFVDMWFAPVIAAVREQTGVEKVVLLGDPAPDTPYDLTYDDLLAAGEESVPEEPDEDDPAMLMYTGGTTGLPKGVLLTQRALMLTNYHIGLTFGFGQSEERYLAQVPMFHAASMGAILSIPTTGEQLVTVPVFNPGDVLAACEKHQCTGTMMVPTMIAMTFADPTYAPERLSSLERLVYGASPMPRPVLERLRRDLPDLQLFQGYGMTESAALVTALLPEDHEREDRLGSAGRAVAGTTVSIQDDAGTLLPTGEVGEVCVRAAGSSCASTGASRRRPTTPSPAAGTTPATPATSTTRATCSSSTAPRT